MFTTGRFILNGIEVEPPIEAVPKVGENGLFVEASFGVENVQPAITPLEFTFSNESAQLIRQYVAEGNIFEGMDFKAEVIGDAGIKNVINGFLDLTGGYKELNPVLVKVKAKFKESRLSLEDRASSLTIDLLREEGFFTTNDETKIPYVVEKPINAVEIAILSITLFLMVKELAEAVEKLNEDVATVIGMTSTSATGSVGAVVYQVAIIAVRLAYIAILLKAIIDLMIEILTQFISLVRNQLGFTYRTIFEKGFEKLGYGFESPISELENYTYVPTIKGEPNEDAIPNSTDYGYNFGELVLLARNQFNAKIAVVNNVIQFRSENDPYWLKTSTYTMPDVLLDEETPKGYNTDELVKSRIIQYKIDDLDSWGLNNYEGTQFSNITQHDNDVPDNKSGLEGFEYIRFPVSLGNRKDGLNTLEELLKIVAKAADVITGVFGGSQNFAERVEKRVGVLKVSQEETSNPKIVYLSGGLIPKNHRDLTSAKYLWDNYINEKSFVENDFKRQRVFYEGVEFGFGLTGFLQTLSNSYFTTSIGKIGKFINLKWDWESDQVIADFWIEEVYTTKLKEYQNEQK